MFKVNDKVNSLCGFGVVVRVEGDIVTWQHDDGRYFTFDQTLSTHTNPWKVSLAWHRVEFSGSAGKMTAVIPGIAQATMRTLEGAFDALVADLDRRHRVKSVDAHAFKILIVS